MGPGPSGFGPFAFMGSDALKVLSKFQSWLYRALTGAGSLLVIGLATKYNVLAVILIAAAFAVLNFDVWQRTKPNA